MPEYDGVDVARHRDERDQAGNVPLVDMTCERVGERSHVRT